MFNLKQRVRLSRKQIQFGTLGLGLAALMGVGLTSCSDYPTHGMLDTVEVRQDHSILSLEGDVYGVTKGGMAAARAAHHDTSLLHNYQNKVWESVSNAEALPDVDLQYPNVPEELKEELKELRFILAEIAHEKLNTIDQAIEADLEEAQSKLLKLRETISVSKEVATEYAERMEDAEHAFTVAKGRLEKAIDHFNTSYESVGVILRKYALEHDLTMPADNYNPLSDYAFADFDENEMPRACPEVDDAIVIDQRSAIARCVYFFLPTEYEPHDKAIRSQLYRPMLKFYEAKAVMGAGSTEKADATGAFADFEVAEAAWEKAQAEPEMKPQRDFAAEEKNRELLALQERVLELESVHYRADKLNQVKLELPDYIKEKVDQYIEAIHSDMATMLEKETELEQVEEYASFDGLGDNLEAVVVFTEMILSKNGAEGTMVGLAFRDLNRLEENSEELIVKLFPSSIKPSWAIDPTKPERVQTALLDHVIESAGTPY